MAVWIYAYGRNGLLSDKMDNQKYLDILNSVTIEETIFLNSVKRESPPGDTMKKYYENEENRSKLESWLESLSKTEYYSYLDSIKCPQIEKEALIDFFIADAEQRDREEDERFNAAYSTIKSGNVKSKWELSSENRFVNRLHYFRLTYDGLSVNLINDLVRISGPFDIFSKYFVFLQYIPAEIRAYYHSYFKQVLKAFKSEFILYAHEWSGMDDEDNKAFNFAELKESSRLEINSSDSLETMDKFYYESL